MTLKENRTREELKRIFIEALNEPQAIWNRGWQILRHERNISGKEYKGLNQFYLSLITHIKHYSDNRWFTYNQAKKLSTDGTHVYVKKGEKGYPIEKWFTRLNQHDMSKEDYEKLLDKANSIINRQVKNSKGHYNNTFEFQEMERIISNTDIESRQFDITFTNYTVFNANQIEGIKPIERRQLDFDKVAVAKEVNENYIQSQGITIYHTAEGRAYYRPADDTIVIPLADTFHDEEEYLSTLAHECCHSTGHSSRLNRNIENTSGDEDYAIEELRAELSSVFLCNELSIRISDEHIENHKAYVQSWISALQSKDGEKILNDAFKDVYIIADYIKEKGQYEKVLHKYEGLFDKQKEIKLINSKSVLDCESDIEMKRHIKELSNTLDKLKTFENEICIISTEGADTANKGEILGDTEMMLKELFDEKLKYYDLTKGTDFKIDKTNDMLIVSCYGATYKIEGKEHIRQIDIKVRFKDEDKSFTKIFDKGNAVNKVIDKVHSLKK